MGREALPPKKHKAIAVFHGIEPLTNDPYSYAHIMDIVNCAICRSAYEADPDAFDIDIVEGHVSMPRLSRGN